MTDFLGPVDDDEFPRQGFVVRIMRQGGGEKAGRRQTTNHASLFSFPLEAEEGKHQLRRNIGSSFLLLLPASLGFL